jgi:BON domain
MNGWKFAAASSTGVDADFPIIFADNPADVASIEAELNTKLASLTPDSTPEYPASIGASAVAAATPGAAPTSSPEVASLPPPVAPLAPEASPTAARHHRPVVASVPKPPKISLTTRVTDELHANRKLRRVQAYTTGGTVTLFGKVFDDNDKVLAERTARHVTGVTGVVNNLTTDEQAWAQNQSRIQQELQNAGLTGVTVKVIGKSAYLSGEVKTQLEKDRAVTITEGAAPVRVHENLIRIAVGSVF